ncbi:MAG: sensor domain-containing diguanylate cyclase [Butyrivibrio sp.]|nr:sensor domain-containing diguanylate cyclase [Butyrivibrio sp.]
MDKIWEFFENMNEYVYVSDIDSDELIYMNKKARDTHGIENCESLAGKKCHEVLQNSLAPCCSCNKCELKQGYFKEYPNYNPIFKRHLLVKDTLVEYDGRRCRLELAVDVTAQEMQVSMVRGYQNLEELVNEGIRLALQTPTPNQSIDVLLEYLGKALNSERAYVFEKNEDGSDDNTYEWVAKGVTPEKENLQNVPPEVCADWYESFDKNIRIMIDDIENIREDNPLKYETLKRQSIRSLAVVPLYDDMKAIGFYGVDNPSVGSLEYASNMLQIMGHFIVSALKRRNLMRELEDMSFHDQLTGLGNRHAMNVYTENMSAWKTLGVVYCDVTGLKYVNDTRGHGEGDKLIINACECLKRVFGGCGLFRIGGDELLALCPQIDNAGLKSRISELKEDMRRNSVSMAVGAVWESNVGEDIDKVLVSAEALMYEDKAAYYRASGIDRRKI